MDFTLVRLTDLNLPYATGKANGPLDTEHGLLAGLCPTEQGIHSNQTNIRRESQVSPSHLPLGAHEIRRHRGNWAPESNSSNKERCISLGICTQNLALYLWPDSQQRLE